MTFMAVGLLGDEQEAIDFNHIIWYAKVGCAFRDLTKKKRDKVILTFSQIDKIT